VSCAEVGLRKLLALSVQLDGHVEVALLFMLLTHTQVRHYLDRDEIAQLELKTLKLGAGPAIPLLSLILDLVAKTVTLDFRKL